MTAIAQATPLQLQWHQQRRDRMRRLGGVERGEPKAIAAQDERDEALERIWPEITPKPIFLVDQDYPLAPSGWKDIVREVCAAHGFTLSEILGGRRSRPLCRARHEAFYRLSRETTMSLPQIGYRMGGKDHTTVINGIKKHKARMGQG